jgi:hypothetical protein
VHFRFEQARVSGSVRSTGTTALTDDDIDRAADVVDPAVGLAQISFAAGCDAEASPVQFATK